MPLGEWVLDLLFPPRCPFCAKVGVKGMCHTCADKLERTEPGVFEGSPYGRCAAPLYYENEVRESLLRYKFQGARTYARAYAQLVAQSVSEHFSGEFDTLTWVPVSEKRRRSRGYDQAYLLARETAEVWGVKPEKLLRKVTDNAPQSGMEDAAQRRANVLGVYEAVSAEAVRGKRILLIDDILTTGSTLGECVRVLREAGAQSVVCAVLAATRKRS